MRGAQTNRDAFLRPGPALESENAGSQRVTRRRRNVSSAPAASNPIDAGSGVVVMFIDEIERPFSPTVELANCERIATPSAVGSVPAPVVNAPVAYGVSPLSTAGSVLAGSTNNLIVSFWAPATMSASTTSVWFVP